jgi:hypothetical protein
LVDFWFNVVKACRVQYGGIEMKIAASAFALFGLIIAAPAWAQTPDDNPVINAYRQHGSNGLPDDNFIYNAYQRHPFGTPDDNFVQDMMSPRPNSGIDSDPADPLLNGYTDHRSGYGGGWNENDDQ